MYFVIGADIVPTSSNVQLFQTGNSRSIVGEELEEFLKDAEYRVFNIEVPLTNQETPICKYGPNLLAPTAAVAGYKELGIDLLTLANNHILDQGEQGLISTIDVLESVGICHVGAGKNLAEASEPFVFTFAGKKIGVYACTEHEFSFATKEMPGANPFDPLYSLDCVEQLRKKVDYVIVLYHGGKEHFRYPSPNLQKVCRRFVEKGANLIVCQHSHCIGCEEIYKGATIVYGQGNFLFDYNDNVFWNTSLLISVDEQFDIAYIPLKKQDNGVRIASDEQKQTIISSFQERSLEITRDGFIDNKYAEFSREFTDFYLSAFSGRKSMLHKVINKITKGKWHRLYLNKTYNEHVKIQITNYINCESHRELVLKMLEKG